MQELPCSQPPPLHQTTLAVPATTAQGCSMCSTQNSSPESPPESPSHSNAGRCATCLTPAAAHYRAEGTGKSRSTTSSPAYVSFCLLSNFCQTAASGTRACASRARSSFPLWVHQHPCKASLVFLIRGSGQSSR